MSKYQSYARRLDESFKAARTQYNTAYNTLVAAQKAFDAESRAPVYRGHEAEHEETMTRLKVRLYDAQAAFDQAKHTAWPGFDDEAERIGKELEEAARRDGLANPDAIDTNGLELLKSGVLSVDDYASMQERYAGNPTMLKLVGKYAEEAAAALGNDPYSMQKRGKLNQIAEESKDGRAPVLRAWDALRDCANRMSNLQRGRTDNAYTAVISERWEDVCGAAIEGF